MGLGLSASVGIVVLAALAVGVWQGVKWHKSVKRVGPGWKHVLGAIANDQFLGHHRDARNKAVRAMRHLQRDLGDGPAAASIRARLAELLAKDPIYPQVLEAIQAACVAHSAVSEMTLCMRLRHLMVEDIRQCEELAEHFGQIRRSGKKGEPLLIARLHHA